ncbi:signal peptidase I [Rhizobium leguminosarum]|uniref:signal peptidase I n=1 Tax=Rhizobium leguminosarum TaxID=384 RepID=UPI0021BBF4DA|nr:signal peptidase I [Rhizobium leguminosarum]
MQILRAFRARRPICAATLGFLFGPDVVTAYLGRGWTATAYFTGGIVISIAQLWLFGVPSAAVVGYFLILVWRLIGLLHGYRAAKMMPADTVFPWYSRWYSLALIFLIAPFALAMLVRSFAFQPFTIPSSSMLPNLRSGDYMFAQKYAYGYSRYSLPYGLGPERRIFEHRPERGDVVMFRTPMDPRVDYVKRVVGLPGDRIQMRSGVLYLNGTAVEREPAGDLTYQSVTVQAFKETLPFGRSYTIVEQVDNARGDNTREFVVPDGHYFVLGDNRDNSLDSRFDMGFIPDDNIYAKAAIVLFNSEDGSRQMSWIQ